MRHDGVRRVGDADQGFTVGAGLAAGLAAGADGLRTA
jgi:hypothetical protein